jgi:Fe-S cluster assembly protein SufD
MNELAFSFLKEEYIPDDLQVSFRKKAFDAFKNIGAPTRRSDSFKYIPLAKLYAHDFEIAISKSLKKEDIEKYVINECQDHYLVLINGKFYPSLSAWNHILTVNSLNGAMNDYAIFLQNRLQVNLKKEKNPFALLNASFHENGVFIFLPKDTKIEKPLQILNLTINFDSPNIASFPRIHGFIGQNSSISILHTTNHIDEGQHLCMPYIDFVLDENSEIQFKDLVTISEDNWHLADYRFLLKKAAKLSCIDFSKGAKTIRRDYRATLSEEFSEVDLKGLHFLEKDRLSHTNVLIEHLAPNCISSQLFKYVVDDNAKSSFEGKIYVSDIAQKTKAYQMNKNLILSDDASAFSKPNLEIFADDVKASHGATFGQISDEEMFYLRSKGILKEKAKQMIIDAFCSEILDDLPSINSKN